MVEVVMMMVMTAGNISVPTDMMCFPGGLHCLKRTAGGVIHSFIRPFCRSHDLLSWGGDPAA